MGGDAIPILTQNLDEERAMMDWIKSNTPVIITQLWPDIAPSVVGTEAREATSYMEAGEGKEDKEHQLFQTLPVRFCSKSRTKSYCLHLFIMLYQTLNVANVVNS